jgi:hypothetical protein
LSKYQWSVSQGRYLYSATGTSVSSDRIRGWVEETVEKARQNLESIARLRQSNKINNAEWVIRSGEELKNMHRSLAMIANGGKAQMDASAWAQVGGILRREFGYLNRFASLLDNMPEGSSLTDEFVTRAGSYASAGFSTYTAAERARMQSAGMDEERNILGNADHCDGCVGATAQGWVAIGTLTPIGSRQCMSRCRCHYEFRKTEIAVA